MIREILIYLPRYLADFASLVVGPKRFMKNKNASENTRMEDTWRESLRFLAGSLILVVAMTAPLLPPGVNLWLYLGGQGVTWLLAVSLHAIALRLAWRIVGGQSTVRMFFVTYAYFFGVMSVISALFILLSEGVFKVFADKIYARVRELQRETEQIFLPRETLEQIPDFIGSSIPTISFLILIVGFLFITSWGILAWGAYRELNGLSKWRSFIALTIMVPLGWGIIAVLIFVSRAIQPN